MQELKWAKKYWNIQILQKRLKEDLIIQSLKRF